MLLELSQALEDDGAAGRYLDALCEAVAEGETLSVVLFVTGHDDELRALQDAVAAVAPGLRDFETEYHVTLAYAAGVPPESVHEAVPAARELVARKSFSFEAGPVRDLVNQKGEGVVYLEVESPEIAALAGELRQVLERFGGRFSFPKFRGHLTLAYRDEPITDEERAAMGALSARVSVESGPEDIRITQKDGENWKRLG